MKLKPMAVWATCTSPHSLTYSSPSALTEHIFQVRAVDIAGNRAAEFEMRLAGASYEAIARAGGGIISSVTATRAASEDALVAYLLGAAADSGVEPVDDVM